jgi:HK97 family phage major capsid protein
MYVEEAQLLMGGGTGTDLNGIYTQATAYAAPIAPTQAGNMTKIDVIRLALLQAYLAEYPATGIVLHPSDWADIELTKTDNGQYLFTNPQNGNEPRLWRLPVVDTQAMTLDNFLVGAFKLGAQIFDREDANVEISTEDQDNFIKNLVTIRAEERLALAVYRPEILRQGRVHHRSGLQLSPVSAKPSPRLSRRASSARAPSLDPATDKRKHAALDAA